MVSSVSSASYAALTQATNGKGGKYDIIAMAKILADETGTYSDDQKFQAYDLLFNDKAAGNSTGFGIVRPNYVDNNFSKYTQEERGEYAKLLEGSSFMKRVMAAGDEVAKELTAIDARKSTNSTNWNGEIASNTAALKYITSIANEFTRRAIGADDAARRLTASIGFMADQNKQISAGTTKKQDWSSMTDAAFNRYLKIGQDFLGGQKTGFGTIQDTISLFGKIR